MPNTTMETPRDIREQLDMYRRILDSIHNGVLVTNAEGMVTHFNKPYGKFLGLDPDAQIGKHCSEVLDNTRMHVVAKTGVSEINQAHQVMGQNMVVQRIPIKKDGKVIAVFGQVMFKDVRDVRKLANRLSMLESKLKLYEQELINLRSTRYTFDSIIGNSEALKDLKREALKATANPFPVLITGESGTGKELFAQAIHHASHRKLYPFVRINCAAIPKDLLESELFGYEKGAFTGALPTGKPGKFELAHQGTLFLDEIGDLPLEMQPKLLRVLEEKEFERVGGTRVTRSDFRLIAATNQNLEEMISEGRFRKDLFYRLNVIGLHIPALRERRDDIIPIAGHLLRQIAAEESLPDMRLDVRARQVLVHHDWPGNVRELSNALERALSSVEGNTLRLSNLPFYLHRGKKQTAPVHLATPLKDIVMKAEIEAICQALRDSGHNKALAAKVLGIHRTLLYKKMKKYGISLSLEA
jgi:PAS domain S-box-containing protein